MPIDQQLQTHIPLATQQNRAWRNKILRKLESRLRLSGAIALVLPILIPDRQPIEELPVLVPLWHAAIHQADETCIVGRFEQMHHLVHHDVLKALSRFF
jgi:hypothetical protein